jgi:hypothetical protein
MSHSNFVKPGIAAIALAVLFPTYWLFLFGAAASDFETALAADMTSLTFSDLLFVIIGALEIYLYLSLRRIFKDHLNSSAISVSLLIMASLVAALHLTVLVDVFLALTQTSNEVIEVVIGLVTVGSIAVMILYALVAILFSIFVFINDAASTMLKGFAGLLLVAALFQLTVIFAFLALVLFPLALILLSIYFLKEPQTVEVV